jgi:ElaB/YqjD/DUF883 family membrane-anchored ribosome-binding protein
MKDQAMEVLSRAGQATKDVSRRAAGAVGDAYRATVATGAEWEDSLEKLIRRNPMTSILVTAGVSLLIGFALGRETARPRHGRGGSRGPSFGIAGWSYGRL